MNVPLFTLYGFSNLWNNTIDETVGDGIRVTGGIVDIRNNTVSAGEYAARVASYNTKYSAGSNREFTGKYGSMLIFLIIHGMLMLKHTILQRVGLQSSQKVFQSLQHQECTLLV